MRLRVEPERTQKPLQRLRRACLQYSIRNRKLMGMRTATPPGRRRLHLDGSRRGAPKRCAELISMVYEVVVEGKSHRLQLEKAAGEWLCHLDGQPVHIDAVIPRRDVLSLIVDGRAYEIKREQAVTDLHMWVGSTRFAVELRDPRSLRSRQKAAGDEKGPRQDSGSHAGPHRASAGGGDVRG